MDLAQLRRLFAPVKRRINGIMVRGVILKADDSGPIQTLKSTILSGEIREKIERVGHYGFASNPPPKSEAVYICKNGDRDHMVAIAVDDRNTRRKDLKPGESAQYNGITGNFFHLFNTGIAQLKATAKILQEAPLYHLKASTSTILESALIKLGSDDASDGLVRKSDLAALTAKHNSHTHPAITTATIGMGPPGVVTVQPTPTTHTATASTKVFSE